MLDGLDFQHRKAYYSCCAGEGTAPETTAVAGMRPDATAPPQAAVRGAGWRRFRAAIRPSQRRSGNRP
jgi:hypothetical protein